MTRAKDSVLKVESVKERKVQASDEKQDTRQPIKLKHGRVKNNAAEISGAYNPVNGSVNKLNMSSGIDKINEATLPASYEADKQLQKIISSVKTREVGKIARLPSPWREKFNALSVNEKNFLYMDHRLVIPQNLRASIMSALHYGHPGRDTMLRGIADRWPKCHREVVNTAKVCERCSKAGKNVKVLQKQSEFGKISRSTVANEEIAIELAGPFQNAKQEKNICSCR